MNTSTATTTQQILFIDSQVQDLDQLIAGVQPNTTVYVLHPQENGIAQITTILQQHSAIETVYLVAHGQPGCLYLGNTIFNQETLPTVSELLKNWNINQLLIYACNLANGETGETFLHSLHHYTKAKIAASSRPIGKTELGQNWQLNKTTHPMEIKSVFNPEVMASYSGVLAAGDLDTTFSGDGKVLTVGNTETFDRIARILLQSDGKIIVARNSLVLRYNSNGSLDTSFDGDGQKSIINGVYMRDVALQADGKILLTTSIFDSSSFSSSRLGFLRYNSNGSLDTSFDGDGKVITNLSTDYDTGYDIRDMVLQADGKILVAGKYNNNFVVARFNSNGTPDTSFSGDGKLTTDFALGYDEANSIAVQPDGKIVVVGSTNNPANSHTFAAARYNSNGTLDSTFSGDGKFTTSGFHGQQIALQSDSKILVGGSDGGISLAVARLNSNGSLDTSFDGDGIATPDIYLSNYIFSINNQNMVLQPNGKIILVGQSNNDVGIARFNNNGSLDTTFSGDGKLTTDLASSFDYAEDVAVQTDGKIVVAGTAENSVANYLAIVRYKGDTVINGTANNDILTGSASPETIKGLGGNDQLSGLGGNDTLNGGLGNDTLIGGPGSDTFVGGGGADKLLYNTNAAFTKLAVGVDTMTDFTIAQGDKIVLDKTTFPKITSVAGTGFSNNSEFAKVTSDALAATRAADIVYNTATGGLFYNQNGTAAGFGTGAKFLTLTNKPVLTENQFLIQA